MTLKFLGDRLSGQRIALMVGAGATVCEAGNVSTSRRPPLDRLYFSEMPPDRRHSTAITAVEEHLASAYGISLVGEFDSLEALMAFLYTDGAMRTRPSAESFVLFRQLVADFNSYLAQTTNAIDSKAKGPIYRLLARFMDAGVRSSEIGILTFNQDIQIEKALHAMNRTAKWRDRGGVFVFPDLYAFEQRPEVLAWPEENAFPTTREPQTGIELLKLHGSLNWVTEFDRPDPTFDEMFSSDRTISVASYRSLVTNFQIERPTVDDLTHTTYTQPVVIPPVVHKGSVFPEILDAMWERAEDVLRSADIIVIFGYSCPAVDYESANLLRRSLVSGQWKQLMVVNPDPTSAARFGDLMGTGRNLQYFRSVDDFYGAFVNN